MTDKSDTLPAARLQELARTIDPKLNLEPDAEKVVQDVLDDFVENLASFACELAVHRSSTTLEARDIQLALGAFISMTRTLSRARCVHKQAYAHKNCVSLFRERREELEHAARWRGRQPRGSKGHSQEWHDGRPQGAAGRRAQIEAQPQVSSLQPYGVMSESSACTVLL